MSEELGPLVRLWGLATAQLPPSTAAADDLAPFLISILQEAVPFIDSAAPKSPDSPSSSSARFWKAKGDKTYSGATAKVEVSERVVPTPELEMIVARNRLPYGQDHKISPETWACRRSVHEDAATTGTASWGEFYDSFKVRHAEVEEKFTPNVLGGRRAITWNCAGVEAEEGGERWTDFTMVVEEMKHKVGGPLSHRAFPVLQMTAVASGKKEFIVVQIPVNDLASTEHGQITKEKGIVVAFYTSVERIRKLPESGEIEWLMATASDAKGVLPVWIQAKAVTAIVAKDVQLFLTWIAKERAPPAEAKEPAQPEAKVEAGAETEAQKDKSEEVIGGKGGDTLTKMSNGREPAAAAEAAPAKEAAVHDKPAEAEQGK